MKIQRIHIRNLYSYDDTSVDFGPLNLIVGTNASGKTNLIRILKLLTQCDKSGSIADAQLSNESRYQDQTDSMIQVELEFSEDEVRMLLELPINAELTAEEIRREYEECRHSTLIMCWKPIPDSSGARPDLLMLRFGQGMAAFSQEGQSEGLGFVRQIPGDLSGLRNLVRGMYPLDGASDAYNSFYEARERDVRRLKELLNTRGERASTSKPMKGTSM